MERKERIAVLKEYYDEANVGGQPNKYLIRKQQALQETIAEAERLDKVAIGEFIRKNCSKYLIEEAYAYSVAEILTAYLTESERK